MRPIFLNIYPGIVLKTVPGFFMSRGAWGNLFHIPGGTKDEMEPAVFH